MGTKIQRIEINTNYNTPIHCPFCGQKVIDLDSDNSGEAWCEPCPHTLFIAHDMGFEYRSERINDHLDLPEDEDEMRKTLVSPFCAEIFYCYYGDEDAGPDDIKEWEIQNSLQESDKNNDSYRIPAFIKLVFRWDEENLERTISLAIETLAPTGIEEEPK